MDYDINATQSEALLCCLSPPSVEALVYILNHDLLFEVLCTSFNSNLLMSHKPIDANIIISNLSYFPDV
jgi:hypothetical protein